MNLNLFPLYTWHALLVVALKLNTNYNTKVMKGTCGAYIKIIFFRSVAHADVILESGDLQTNAHNSNSWCILILKIVYYSTYMQQLTQINNLGNFKAG